MRMHHQDVSDTELFGVLRSIHTGGLDAPVLEHEPPLFSTDQTSIFDGITRRTALKAGIAGAAGLVLGAAGVYHVTSDISAYAERNNWPVKAMYYTQVGGRHYYEAEDKRDITLRRKLTQYAVGVPGYGGRDGGEIVDRLIKQQAYDRACQYAYLTYPTENYDRYNILDMGQRMSQQNNIELINFDAKSMGGLTSLYVALGVNKRVQSIIMNCSPRDIDDARDALLAKVAVSVASFLSIDANLQSSITVNAFDKFRDPPAAYTLMRLLENGPEYTIDILHRAVVDTMHGEAPSTELSGLKFMADQDLDDRVKDLKRIIHSDTLVYYQLPDDPTSDETVLDLKAFAKWQEFFAQFGIDVVPVRYRDRGHAVTSASIERIIPKLRGLYEVAPDAFPVTPQHRHQLRGALDI